MRALLRALALVVVPMLLAAQGSVSAPVAGASPFPHARHARLFPLCSSCHTGITSGDAFRLYPSPMLCGNCHNGVIQRVVRWQAPPPKGPRLLVFSHTSHFATAKAATCASCHGVDGSTQWMNVAHAAPVPCMSCHTQGRSTHLADATKCSTCHRVLTAATALTDAEVAGLPKPVSHARADFVSTHGAGALATQANCATCHARESCLRCHVDGSRVSVIQALGKDPRVARLVAGRPGVYPMPADHRSAQFAVLHGSAAQASVARCATCHTRNSCESCHTGDGARAVLARMPTARDATAPGVQIRHARFIGPPDLSFISNVRAAPMQSLQAPALRHDTTQRIVRVHAVGFARAHGAQAASGAASCASCHAQRFCTDCHTGERVTRRYHVANFVSTHAPQAYRRETDCAPATPRRLSAATVIGRLDWCRQPTRAPASFTTPRRSGCFSMAERRDRTSRAARRATSRPTACNATRISARR